MQLRRRKNEWWVEPSLKPKPIRIPVRVRNVDPLDPTNDYKLTQPSRIGAFKHSRLWVRYNRLQSVDTGYITPLYSIDAIATRYGLTDNASKYFKKYILPKPFDIVRRRSVQAHHWSRFTLMVLDTVLLDLQSRGYMQFMKTFHEHVDLVQRGVSYLEDYYATAVEHRMVDPTDRHGVQWLE